MVEIMGISFENKEELATYQLKGIAQFWFTQWKFETNDEEGLLVGRSLRPFFLFAFFPLN